MVLNSIIQKITAAIETFHSHFARMEYTKHSPKSGAANLSIQLPGAIPAPMRLTVAMQVDSLVQSSIWFHKCGCLVSRNWTVGSYTNGCTKLLVAIAVK